MPEEVVADLPVLPRSEYEELAQRVVQIQLELECLHQLQHVVLKRNVPAQLLNTITMVYF